MSSLSQKVMSGTVWMLGFKFSHRMIGVVSTVILARLLVPEDFGLVAMAMAVYAFIDLLGNLGFEQALIKNQEAERRHYDTAWTFLVLYGVVSALILIAVAPLVSSMLGDDRLVPIMYALALLAFIQGWQNIGIVAFRKELRFGKDFQFLITKKLVAFAVTVVLAILFRSYWALIGGMLASRFVGVAMSYAMHPYRPQFSLAATRDIFGFSLWVFLNHLARYVRGKGPYFFIGNLAGVSALGLFKISREISNLPTSQFEIPIMRVIFPGYSKIAHSAARLRGAFLKVHGMIATLTIPAGIGIVVLADPLVNLMLGPNWLAAIPLIQVLGLYGATRVLQGNTSPLFMAIGKPYLVSVLVIIEILVSFPLVVWLLLNYSLEVAAWGFVIGGFAVIPVGMAVIARVLDASWRELTGVVWRPVIAAGVMGTTLLWLQQHLPQVTNALEAALQLAILVPVGGGVYAAALVSTWLLAGVPHGAEYRLLELSGLGWLIPGHRGETG